MAGKEWQGDRTGWGSLNALLYEKPEGELTNYHKSSLLVGIKRAPLGIERQFKTKTTLREGNRNKKAVQLSVQLYCVRSSHVILCDCKENGSAGRRGRKQEKERSETFQTVSRRGI